jgi:hypothetical protein
MSDKPKGFGPDYISITKCRICEGNRLANFFDLGSQPLANGFLKESELNQAEVFYPLRVLFCEDCNLVQLGEAVNPEILFLNYVYFSSGMPASKHFRDYAEDIAKRFVGNPEDLLVEIGSNDGHFLSVIKETHGKILGVDPAKNLAKLANQKGISTIPDFFSEKIAKGIFRERGGAKVIVGNNVVAHIFDYHDLLKAITALLADDGVFVFEAPYLVDMFENLSFDTIYHEHLSYLAIKPLVYLFDKYDLEIFDVEIHPIQGNSIRVFSARKGQRKIEDSVDKLLAREKELKLDRLESYRSLAARFSDLKKEVMDLLGLIKTSGKKIAGYGAPAKGNTLLNFFGIGPDILDYATEELPSKIGLFTPGMHIPVVYVKQFRENYPDYAFLLAWNYKTVALEKERGFILKGGKFIMPVGSERIL